MIKIEENSNFIFSDPKISKAPVTVQMGSQVISSCLFAMPQAAQSTRNHTDVTLSGDLFITQAKAGIGTIQLQFIDEIADPCNTPNKNASAIYLFLRGAKTLQQQVTVTIFLQGDNVRFRGVVQHVAANIDGRTADRPLSTIVTCTLLGVWDE